MKLTPHSNAWYERLATLQQGYFYPWRSTVAPGGGEDAFDAAVRLCTTAQLDLLDAGCGHGAFTLELAPLCRSIIGYDRVAAYIELADALRAERGQGNARFLLHDSGAAANDGAARLPVTDASIDLIVSRRGPTHWISDAPRSCRPGARLIQLNPLSHRLVPPWNRLLPEPLRLPDVHEDPDVQMRNRIEQRLTAAGMALERAEVFDVPEWFSDPFELYRFRTFGAAPEDVPSWEVVSRDFERAFTRLGGSQGIEHRQRQLLWTAVVP